MTIEQYAPRDLTPVHDVNPANMQDVAIQRLGEWARSAEAAHHIASTLVQTSFCPDQFRGKSGEATAAILAGLEVGLQPMAALRSFDIIQGTAAPRAITLRAVVQAQGHEMVLVESTAERCKMKGRRRGTSEWSTVTWTMDRARSLNLANKPNWKQQPTAMLLARATSELARLIASDAILGIGYSSEEVADGGPVDAQVAADTTTPTSTPGTRRMGRNLRPVDPEPEPDETAPQEPPPAAEESPLLDTRGSLAKRMFATFRDAGIDDKDQRLAFISAELGRQVTTSAEMTDDEASQVIDALEAMQGESDGQE